MILISLVDSVIDNSKYKDFKYVDSLKKSLVKISEEYFEDIDDAKIASEYHFYVSELEKFISDEELMNVFLYTIEVDEYRIEDNGLIELPIIKNNDDK